MAAAVHRGRVTRGSPSVRVLLVTRNLPPLVGGMERLNWHLAEELVKIADVRMIGPPGSAGLAPPGVTVREAPLKPLWQFLWRARALARREARAWRPDIVFAGSGLTAPLARSAARVCGARTAVYVHGLDVAVRNVAYRVIWLPAIRAADRVIANSRATADLCRSVGIQADHIGIVHPGVDLPDDEPHPTRSPFVPKGEEVRHGAVASEQSAAPVGVGAVPSAGEEGTAFRRKGVAPQARGNVSANAKVLLSVGRLSARKGLREFVTRSLPAIIAAHPETVLLIVGDAPTQALHAEAQTPASIQAAADAAGVGRSIRFLGVITDYAELGRIYRAANVHVFPVREIAGDPEGFGMVAVEAAAHGLPTAAFATGGVVDAVAEGRSGYLVPPGDYAAFADVVIRALAAGTALHDTCIAFARGFAWPAFGAQVARQLDIA